MATYKDMGITDVAFYADGDLTLAQYYHVTVASTAGYVKVATGACNPAALGVLQNAPSAGQEARVRLLGLSKVFAVTGSGSALQSGKYFTVNASGQAVPVATDGGSPVSGRWLDTTAPVSASRYGQAFIWPFATCAISAS